VAGRVQLLLPADGGGQKLMSGHGPGASFGEPEMFGDTPYAVDCRAIEDTVLLFVPSVAVLPALARCGELAQRFLRALGSRMHALVLDLAQVTQKSAESRIASLLLRLADDRPAAEPGLPGAAAPAAPTMPGPPTVRLPDRKRAIASRLSVAPETFSRALRAFQDDGLIRVDGYRVQILDPQGLSAAARD
jgi:CRP-like cAMP-binding protein